MKRFSYLILAAVLAGPSLWSSGGGRAADRGAVAVTVPGFLDPHLHGDTPDILPQRPLRFLTTDDEPPFNFLGPDGALTGYNVDLTRALCAELAVTCSIEVRRFDALMPALAAGAADAVVASLAITEASRAVVDFSLPTMRMTARFAARDGAGSGDILPETVERLVIGVQGGTAHEAYLRRFFPRAVPKLYTDPDSLRAALRGGAVDLIFADGLSLSMWLNGTTSGGCCRFAGGPFADNRYFGEGTGIAVRKGDAALKQALDYGLQRLSARGVLTDLYLKYVPLSFW